MTYRLLKPLLLQVALVLCCVAPLNLRASDLVFEANTPLNAEPQVTQSDSPKRGAVAPQI
jgi:hypothetical protein